MTKFHTALGGLLALQVLLAAILFWSHQQPGQQNQQEPLLAFDQGQLDKLVVSDAQQTVTLTKSGGAWLIPDFKQLPADAAKLKGLLDRLHGLPAGWPVATSQNSHSRFEVAEDKFQRRLQLYQGGKRVAELFVGTSPGFKKAHVRRSGDDSVYAVGLNSFDWPVNHENWLDKAVLAANDISAIKGPDYALQKTGESWQFADATNGPKVDAAKARQLAAALSSLKVLPPVDALPSGEQTGITLQVANPQRSWQYRWVKAGDKYFVSRDDRDVVFSISQPDFERIAGIDKAQLTLPAEPADAGKPESDAEAGDAKQ